MLLISRYHKSSKKKSCLAYVGSRYILVDSERRIGKMSPEEPCYLLRLPRELRNHIYDYLTSMHRLPDLPIDTFKPAVVLLRDTAVVNVLLLNRQVHDEYTDHIKSRLRLSIHFHLDADLRYATCPVIEPARRIQTIQRCTLTFTWLNIRSAVTRDWRECETFIHDPMIYEQRCDQAILAWTPSKGETSFDIVLLTLY